MASGSSTSVPPHAPPAQGPGPSEYDQYIRSQLRKTQNYVRMVDVAEALLTITVAALAYLLFVSVLDHWLFRGGLPTWARYLAWAVFVASILAYAARTVLPHLLRRVSWLYAADTIERAEPSLKNSLLNFLMLRGDHRGVPQVVYQSLEQRAAADISKVPVELAVDRSRIVKIGYVLIAVALACAAYKVLSPKDLLPSVGRVLAPWSDIPPQTRVKIRRVDPGDTEALLLSQLPVTAEIDGLDDDDTVQLIYSTTDQQAVDVAVPMYVRDGDRHHSCLLPEDPSGLSQDVVYRIEAGDCTSATYSVRVVVAPTIHVKKIEYAYPAYTELDARTVEGVGDIKAIEGTLVVIHAEASHEMASAYVELEGIRGQTVPMKFSGQAARCRLRLQRKLVGNESLPLWTNYQLKITTPRGDQNENPIRHRIQITPDLPPVVEIIKPEQAKVSVPLDGHLDLEVRARDQDYQLSDVRIVADHQQRSLLDEALAGDQRPFAAPVRTSFRFAPQKYSLQPGDVVRYAAIAVDNKTPQANQAATADYEILITDPEGRSTQIPPADQPQPDGQDRQPPADEGGDGQPLDAQQGDGQQGAGQQGQPAADESQQGDSQDGDGQGQGAAPGEQTQPGEQPMPGESDSSPDAGGQKSNGRDGQAGQPQPGAQDQQAPDSGQREGGQPPEGGGQGQPQPGTPAQQRPDQPIDNPGDAFEKALEYMREKQPDQVARAEPQEGESAEKPTGDGARDGSTGRPAPDAVDSGSDQGGQDGVGDQADARSSDQQGQTEAPRPQDQQDQDMGSDSEQQPAGSDQPSPADSRPDQGAGGGGRGNDGQQAPPPNEGENRPREKSGTARQPESDQEPADSSASRQESDSAEGEEGSFSGKGDEGGGQKAGQQGEGAAGQNTPSDTGGSAAQESGTGDTSSRAGDDVASDSPTGQQGDQPGQASDQAGGRPGAAPAADQTADGQPDDGQPEPADGQPAPTPGQREGTGQPGTQQAGGGQAGDAMGEGDFEGRDGPRGAGAAEAPRREPGADDANLEYARQQTDLVLDYLQDQLDRGGVDQELKERFGWTDQQFADFVRRYGDLRERAKSADDQGRAARQELDDALRSLGLRRPSEQVRTGRPQTDKAEGLQQSGRSRPPLEYQEQFDAFRKDAFGDE